MKSLLLLLVLFLLVTEIEAGKRKREDDDGHDYVEGQNPDLPRTNSKMQSGDMLPRKTYKSVQYAYMKYDHGVRISSAMATIEADHIKQRQNRQSSDELRERVTALQGSESDAAGHILAHSLGGVEEPINIFPQLYYINNGPYKRLEAKIGRLVKEEEEEADERGDEAKKMIVTWKFTYPDYTTGRPERYSVSYGFEGEIRKKRRFSNLITDFQIAGNEPIDYDDILGIVGEDGETKTVKLKNVDYDYTFLSNGRYRISRAKTTKAITSKDCKGQITDELSRQYATYQGYISDDAGHIRGNLLGGTKDRINIFPQHAYANQRLSNEIEKEIKGCIQKGNTAQFTWTFAYAGPATTRPTSYTYEVTFSKPCTLKKMTAVTPNTKYTKTIQNNF